LTLMINLGSILFIKKDSMKIIIPKIISKTLVEYFYNNSFIGKGHSAYKSSVNILLENGFIFNIIKDLQPINARSIQIMSKDWYLCKLNLVSKSDSIIIENQTVVIPDKEVVINYASSVQWDPKKMDISERDFRERVFFNNLLELKHFLKVADEVVFPDPFRVELDKRITYFINAINYKSKGDITEAFRSLIGFGSGLTPSGDDFIVGFLSSCYLFPGFISKNIEFIEELTSILKRIAQGKTTDLSLGMLLDACQGLFLSALQDVHCSLYIYNKKKTLFSARRLLKVGSSSGRDLLVGLIYGLDYCTTNN